MNSPDVHMNAQNVLVGLWYGSKKPPMDLLLKPIKKKLGHLQMFSLKIETPHGPATFCAKSLTCLPKLLPFVQSSLIRDADALFAFTLVNIPGDVTFTFQHSTLSEPINQLSLQVD